jgi:hypothetical protein
LPEILSLFLQEKSQAPDYWIGTQDGMLLLGYILNEPEYDYPYHDQADNRAETV